MAGHAGNGFQHSCLERLGYRRTEDSAIGEGGFGKIYTVQKFGTGERYAWKKIPINRTHGREHSLYREKNALETLCQCPFIVKLYHSFQDDSFYCFIIEYANGGDLFNYITERKGGFNIEATRHYSAELIMAIDYMRQHGWLHRDLKPENLLLAADRHLRVCDFGCAKNIYDPTHFHDPNRIKLSTLAGTMVYLAPEVLIQQETTLDSDLWSLGCIIYEFQMGEQVYFFSKNTDQYTQYRNIRDTGHAYIRGFVDKGDRSIRNLVDRLLMPEASHRLGSDNIYNLKSHPFFSRIHWNTLHMTPPPPLFDPVISSFGAQAAAAPTNAAATVAIPTAPTVAPSGPEMPDFWSSLYTTPPPQRFSPAIPSFRAQAAAAPTTAAATVAIPRAPTVAPSGSTVPGYLSLADTLSDRTWQPLQTDRQATAAPTTAPVLNPRAPTFAPSGSTVPGYLSLADTLSDRTWQPIRDDRQNDPYGTLSWSRTTSPEPSDQDEDQQSYMSTMMKRLNLNVW